MEQNTQAVEPKAQYIAVNEIEYQLLRGHTRTFRKHLLTTENLKIDQTVIKGSGDAEEYGVSNINRARYVLDGKATLTEGVSTTEIGPGHLIIIPPGLPWGANLFVNSKQFLTLDIARRVGIPGDVSLPDPGRVNHIRIIDPEDVPPYQPAGHAKTTNRCLFIEEQMEIIEGMIESGGGADRHIHKNNEQMLYTLGGLTDPLLIYYPRGAPHGTGGSVSDPLKLLVIYAPPLGESQNALG